MHTKNTPTYTRHNNTITVEGRTITGIRKSKKQPADEKKNTHNLHTKTKKNAGETKPTYKRKKNTYADTKQNPTRIRKQKSTYIRKKKTSIYTKKHTHAYEQKTHMHDKKKKRTPTYGNTK